MTGRPTGEDGMALPATLYDLPRSLLGFHVELTARAAAPRGTLEERVARLEAREVIQRVLNRYAYSYDAGDIENMMAIYSDDCLLVNGAGTFAGAAAIRTNYEQAILERGLAFHHLSDVEIAIGDGLDDAWATGYLHNLAVRDGNPGGTMASCVFHLKPLDGVWKVVECRIAVSGQHSFGPPAPRRPVPHVARPTGKATTAELFDDADLVTRPGRR